MTDCGLVRGADFLQLDPAAAPTRALTAWLADLLRTSIIDGHLVPGTALPATRVLAEELGISRGVIVEAYQRLREEGLSLIHISEPTRLGMISYAVFCLKKKK